MSRSPSDRSMASLDSRKAMPTINLMAAGSGTPWEDRGAIGVVQAFFKTTFQSMLAPTKLTFSMRRPETSSDVTGFAIASGVMWGVGILIVAIMQYEAISHLPVDSTHPVLFSPQQFWMNSAIEIAAAVAGTWVALKVATILFLKIITPDLTQPVREVLAYNVMGYALGPSILAVIPYVGPPIAGLWILVNWIALAQARLKAKRAGSMTASILTFVAITLGAGAVYLIGSLLSTYVLNWGSLQVPPAVQQR
ncbi:MAG TPA: hypothetical protein VL992_10045 [Tepidisphaeraceae bacterium]|nr:hypothetical protein [Tepidisphaeraceae bacterium]